MSGAIHVPFVCLHGWKRDNSTFTFYRSLKGKGRAIPLQAWTSPEGSRRLRLPDFKIIGT